MNNDIKIEGSDENYHTKGKSKEVLEQYEKIKKSILKMDSDFEICFLRTYISFKLQKQNIVSLFFFEGDLFIILYGKYSEYSIYDEKNITKDIEFRKRGRAQTEIKVSEESDLEAILEFIQLSYKINKKYYNI